MINKIFSLFFAGIIGCVISAALTACSDDNTGSVNISGDCLVQKFVLNDQYEGSIDYVVSKRGTAMFWHTECFDKAAANKILWKED